MQPLRRPPLRSGLLRACIYAGVNSNMGTKRRIPLLNRLSPLLNRPRQIQAPAAEYRRWGRRVPCSSLFVPWCASGALASEDRGSEVGTRKAGVGDGRSEMGDGEATSICNLLSSSALSGGSHPGSTLADRAFCSYAALATLVARGTDSVIIVKVWSD